MIGLESVVFLHEGAVVVGADLTCARLHLLSSHAERAEAQELEAVAFFGALFFAAAFFGVAFFASFASYMPAARSDAFKAASVIGPSIPSGVSFSST